MKQKTLVLDLDETLVSAKTPSEYDLVKKENPTKYHDMDGYYKVTERPNLQEFLDYVFKNFNVIIWTAASKDYAAFIIKEILLGNKDRKVDYVFFKYHCNLSKKYQNGSKNLKLLWENFKLNKLNSSNTIIIDDYDEVYNIQPKNCVIAPAFEYDDENSENDEFLKDLIPLLKKYKQSSSKKPANKINKALKNKYNLELK